MYLKETINFESEIFNLSKINPLVSRYKLYIAYAEEPANNYKFSEDVLNRLSSTIMGCPVVAGFMNEKDGSILGGHEDDLALDENNKVKPTPSPIPVGFTLYDIRPWWELYKGRNYLTTFVYIWDGRFPELENLSDRKIFQSLEVAVDEEPEGKFKIVTEAYALGLCLLENVNPAFKNSTLEKFSLSNIKSDVDLLKKEYEKFVNKYEDIDFTIPSNVKKNAQKGLDLRKEFNRGGTQIGLQTAKFIVKNTVATSEKVRHIANYFPRHAGDNLDEQDPPSDSWISWLLWGGDSGRRWSEKLVSVMNKIDDDEKAGMSYFVDDLQVDSKLESEINLDKNILDTLNITEECSENNKEGDKVIKEAVEKFSLNSSQIHEILNNALAEYKYGENNWRKYWVNCFDETYVYAEDSEECKTYGFKYNILENVATIDMESKEEVIRGGYIPVAQKTEELSEDMSASEAVKEECSENKEELSSNEYVDNTAMQALNDKAAEDNKQLTEENSKLKAEMSEMQTKMSQMEIEMTSYSEENTKLKEFKFSIEKQNKDFSVETTLKEVIDILPKEEIDACRLSAENCTLENIDVWKNEVKAKAFNFSKGLPEKKLFIKMGLPINDKPKNGTGLWD